MEHDQVESEDIRVSFGEVGPLDCVILNCVNGLDCYLKNYEEPEDGHDDDVEKHEKDANEIQTSKEHSPAYTQISH